MKAYKLLVLYARMYTYVCGAMMREVVKVGGRGPHAHPGTTRANVFSFLHQNAHPTAPTTHSIVELTHMYFPFTNNFAALNNILQIALLASKLSAPNQPVLTLAARGASSLMIQASRFTANAANAANCRSVRSGIARFTVPCPKQQQPIRTLSYHSLACSQLIGALASRPIMTTAAVETQAPVASADKPAVDVDAQFASNPLLAVRFCLCVCCVVTLSLSFVRERRE